MSQVVDENRLAKKELRIDRKMNPKSGLSNYNFWMLCSGAPLLGLQNCYVPYDVTPNYHPVLIRASALLLPMWAGEARGCVA
jgi:hypothetical protein